jgi:putative DNA primase/helicase
MESPFIPLVDKLNGKEGPGIDMDHIPDDSAEPIYIVKDKGMAAIIYQELKFAERLAENKITRWYHNNAFQLCDDAARKLLQKAAGITVYGPLSWKPYVLTFRDPEIEASLSKMGLKIFFFDYMKGTTVEIVVPGVKQEILKKEWGLETIKASEIEMELVNWLWTDRLPNKLCVFFGMPDQGKSTVTADIVARLTTGRDMPDRPATLPASDVLMLVAAEEGIADTVKPRLVVAGADLDRVHFVKATVRGEGAKKIERETALDTDTAALEATLKENPAIKLVVIDPILSYMGHANVNKDSEVRPVLNRLKDVAERFDIAILCIAHFNKNNDMAALHRLSGAGAWNSIPRAIWAFVPAPEDEDEAALGLHPGSDEHWMLNAKLNITAAKNRAGLKYTFQGVPLTIKGKETSQPRIVWGDAVSDSLESVLAKTKGPKPEKRDAAMAWLKAYLTVGPKRSGPQDGSEANTVFGDGLAAGHEHNALFRAKERLGIKAYRVGKSWFWELDTTGQTRGQTQDKVQKTTY